MDYTAEQIGVLSANIERISLSAQEVEAKALYIEMLRLDKRQASWIAGCKVVAGAVALIVFFVMGSRDFGWFPYAPQILGLVLSIAVFVGAMIGLVLLGKAVMRARVNKWAQSADLVVRRHDKATS